MSSGHVVINGKKYTLAAGASSTKKKHIDGFGSSGNHSLQTVTSKKAIVRSKSSAKKHVNTMRSKTLHRKAVAKPIVAKNNDPVIVKQTYKTPKDRLNRAKNVNRSSLVGKFSTGSTKMEVSPIAMQPKEEITPFYLDEPPVHNPVVVDKQSMFNRHFDNITPIANKKNKKKRGLSTKKLAPALVALVLVLGVLAYANLPQISMKIAGTRAGFNAKLPNTPSGFEIDGPIKYESGKVAIALKSNTDERSLNILQKPSNLDSASLSSGFLEAQNISYDTFEVAGKKVFVYGQSEATWVSNGIWYNVEGESRLSTDQILDLAKSL